MSTRARTAKRKPNPALAEQRRDEIRRRMLDGTFRTGETSRQLAAEWGIPLPTVQGYAAEVSRSLRVDPDERAFYIGRNVARLDECFADAKNRGEVRSAIAAVEAQNKLIGIEAPQKHEIDVKATLDADESLARRIAGLVAGADAGEDPRKPDA